MDTMADAKAQNIAHFKELANKYDNEATRTAARAIGTKILQFRGEEAAVQEFGEEDFEDNGVDIPRVNVNVWNSESTRVLDFACGTGLVSEVLAPYTKQLVGVDISPEMIEVFNTKVYNHGVPKEEMEGLVVDITEPGTSDDLKLHNFDAAVASLCYHHISDTAKVTQALANRLRRGGRLYVVDLEKASNEWFDRFFHEHQDEAGVVHRHGMDGNQLKKEFEDAGFKDVEVSRPFRVRVWVHQDKLGNHAFKVGPDPHHHGHDHDSSNLDFSKLPTRQGKDGRTLYAAKMQLMLIVGTKA
jgi:SAM-dependent methyltransferase